MERINFHHLHYFWAVAHDGNLTRTARTLRISQSALSAQIRQLEAQIGEPLFERRGRALVLTEAGRIALDYADDIFSIGREMLTTLRAGRPESHGLRIGAVATLSRNFQESFVRPLLESKEARFELRSAGLEDLLARLERHELDVVLSNRPVRREPDREFRCRRIARQNVSIVGHRSAKGFRFPRDVAGAPMILPSRDSDIRTEFDALCERLGVSVHVLVEVDDMATMRLLARDMGALALVPSVVVRDELKSGALSECCVVPDLFESFYAITVERLYQHPLLRGLLSRDETEMLEMGRRRRPSRRARSQK